MPTRTSYSHGEPSWVDLASPDLDASRAFYGGLFGWEAPAGDPAFGGYATFSLGGESVGGLSPKMSEDQPTVWNTYISVDDADKTMALVRDNGGQVVVEPMDVGDLGRMAFLTDPEGAYLGIWQPKQMPGADLQNEEGTIGWTELASRNLTGVLPFYVTVFGWDPMVEGGYTHFNVGSDSVAGAMDMPEGIPDEVPSYWMPYFMTADPAAKAQQAASLGATVLVPFMDVGGVAFSVVRDPHGATFGLYRMTA